MRVRHVLVALASLAPLLSCGSDSATGPRLPADIVIVPNQPEVSQGLTLQLTATVVDAGGRPIQSQHATFTSGDTAIARVTPGGLVTSRGPLGTVRMTAKLGGLTSSVDVTVNQRLTGAQVTPNPLILNPTLSAQL